MKFFLLKTKTLIHVQHVILMYFTVQFHSYTKIITIYFVNAWKYDIQVKFQIVHQDYTCLNHINVMNPQAEIRFHSY